MKRYEYDALCYANGMTDDEIRDQYVFIYVLHMLNQKNNLDGTDFPYRINEDACPLDEILEDEELISSITADEIEGVIEAIESES